MADVHYVLNIAQVCSVRHIRNWSLLAHFPPQPNPPFFDINGISYLSPPVPVLLQILSGAFQPQDFLPSVREVHWSILISADNISGTSECARARILRSVSDVSRCSYSRQTRRSIYLFRVPVLIRSIVGFPYPLTQLSFDLSLKVHGHNFDVIRQSNTEEFNFVNPARRDVVPSTHIRRVLISD